MFIRQMEKSCVKPAEAPNGFYRSKTKRTDQVEELARLWAFSISEAIRQAKSLQIVRYEDVIRDPVHTITKMHKVYGTQLTVPQMNRLSR